MKCPRQQDAQESKDRNEEVRFFKKTIHAIIEENCCEPKANHEDEAGCKDAFVLNGDFDSFATAVPNRPFSYVNIDN